LSLPVEVWLERPHGHVLAVPGLVGLVEVRPRVQEVVAPELRGCEFVTSLKADPDSAYSKNDCIRIRIMWLRMTNLFKTSVNLL
jgi:hypothetical protein